jgi:hypothetical protein
VVGDPEDKEDEPDGADPKQQDRKAAKPERSVASRRPSRDPPGQSARASSGQQASVTAAPHRS